MLALFFLSGGTGLVYEVVWVRMLSLVFGVTAFAVATVLASFMGGLALGAWIFGRWADRMRNPLRVYGILEAAIGVYALLVPTLFVLLQRFYLQMGTGIDPDGHAFTFGAVRFLLAAVVLLFPTILMGGSLPLLARAFATGAGSVEASSRVGVLYGINTLGAVVGTAAAGFILLPRLGISSTIHFAALLNLALGAFIVFASRGADTPAPVPSTRAAPSGDGTAPSGGDRTVLPVLIAFFLCGALSMCYEVYWTRILVLIVGPSVYAFTLMLTAFLAGLALGSIAAAPLLRRWKNRLLLFGALELVIALTCLLTMLLFSRYPYWFVLLADRFAGQGTLYDLVRFTFIFATMLVPTLAMGAAFPVVAGIHYGRGGRIGRSVGTVYSANTAGGIIGSFLAGFFLLPALGIRNGMILFLSLNGLIGFAALVCSKRGKGQVRVGAAALAAVFLLLSIWQWGGVTVWDQRKMTMAPYQKGVRRLAKSPERLDQFHERFDLLYYREGITSTITVRESGGVRTLQTNGKTDASTGADMRTQVMLGQLPMILAGGAERALVIGLASGVTAGNALAQGAERIDVVEIEEAMIEASRFFEEENHGLLDDDRTRLFINDGRNFLLASEEEYDVLISEPSNPWIAGMNNLFTIEAFRLMRDHIGEDGLVAQWLQYYSMSMDDIFSVLHTFAEVFDYVDVYQPAQGDLILIGSGRPVPILPDRFEERCAPPRIARTLREVSIESATDLLTMYLFSIERKNENSAWKVVRDYRLNRDDNMLLEFSAPRHLDDPGLLENRAALAGLHDRSRLHRATGGAHLALAESAVRLWDLTVAEEELAIEESKQDGDLVGVHNLRSRILLSRAGWEKRPELIGEAVAEANRAIRIDPRSSTARFLLGSAAIGQGEWDEAVRLLHEALELGEDRLVTSVYLGIALERGDRIEEAIEAYRTALSIDPENEPARNGLARLERGDR